MLHDPGWLEGQDKVLACLFLDDQVALVKLEEVAALLLKLRRNLPLLR